MQKMKLPLTSQSLIFWLAAELKLSSDQNYISTAFFGGKN